MQLYAVMEMFCNCRIQHGSQEPCVAMEPVNCGSYNWETEFLILFHFDEFEFR